MKKAFFIYSAIVLALLSFTGCKKLVETDAPINRFDGDNIYSKDDNAIAVLTAIYQEMSNDWSFQGANSMTVFAGLSADELNTHDGELFRLSAYQNKLYVASPFWERLYYMVYITNTAIQGITESATLTPAIKQQLLGEAKFMRAFMYLCLSDFHGDVPLLLSNDYRVNRHVARTPVEKVQEQIIADLKEAETLLDGKYFLSDLRTVTSLRIRPNKWAAKALLARAYLYHKDYSEAEAQATSLIENKSMFDTSSLAGVFLADSREAIWQIQATSTYNTFDAQAFRLVDRDGAFRPTISASEMLVRSFEPGDRRLEQWIDSMKNPADGLMYYRPFKYKVVDENAPKTEYLMVLRLAEQYLIRAEARAQRTNDAGAREDLNVIRKRAGLPDTDANGKTALLDAVLKERRSELFAEWGHRWFDLRRMEKIDAVMSVATPLKGGGEWNHTKALYPISAYEIVRNPNLVQNPGY